MESLTAFCKRQNLAKSSVRKVLLAHGYETANGLNTEAVMFAESYFSKRKRQLVLETEYRQIDLPDHLQSVDNKILLSDVKALCHSVTHETEVLKLKVERLEILLAKQQEIINDLEYRLNNTERKSIASDSPEAVFIPSPWETGAA